MKLDLKLSDDDMAEIAKLNYFSGRSKAWKLVDNLPIDDLAFLFNAELYGLMIAWCMADGEMTG
ncbi:MAG: hypothetical protein LIO74_12225 [Ruminococcus sp.]|nr:hypothetical protein [Ruminococcus sp.]